MPYRGGHDATQAVISGHADVVITELPNAMRDIQAGRLKPLASSSRQGLSNTPNFEEIGYAQLNSQVWYGFFVPAGTGRVIPPFLTVLRSSNAMQPWPAAVLG